MKKSRVDTAGQRKSMGLTILLTGIFGPLGMFYSTVPGALIMLVISIPFAFLTNGLSLIVTWPICVIWAVVSTSSHNNKLKDQVR